MPVIELDTPVRQQSFDRYLMAAKEAGMPRDQVENFVLGAYIPLPWALNFHAAAREADHYGSPNLILSGGARGPGKTHATLAQVGLDDCQRYPGIKFLFLRKIQKAAKESFEDVIRSVFGHVALTFTQSPARLKFPNGSRIVLGGFRNESDIDSYLGIEYDGIAIEEGSQLSEKKIDMLFGSVRSSKPGWRVRYYITTNPGGIGHKHIRDTFVIPYRRQQEVRTRFFPSTYKDNPYLSQDYIDYLMRLKGPLGKAWRDGDWDVFEGQAFQEFDYDQHTINPPDIPEHWPRWRAIDWGFAAPFGCLWAARDPDTGRVIVYREAKRAGLTVPQQTEIIKTQTAPSERISLNFADPALWGRKTYEDMVITTAQEYVNNGIVLTRADNNRHQGLQKVHQLLAPLKDGLPGLLISRDCDQLIDEVSTLLTSTSDPEDVDSDQDDHLFDCLKYLLTNINLAQTVTQSQQTKSPIAELFS